MKFKVTEGILDYKNQPIKEGEEQVTYRGVFNMALNSFEQEEKPTSEEKAKCFQLTLKLFSNNEVDLSVDERALIKSRVEKIYNSPLIFGRVTEFLEKE